MKGTAVVLGGTGAIGSAIVTELAGAGYEVVALHRGRTMKLGDPRAVNLIGDAGSSADAVNASIHAVLRATQRPVQRPITVFVHALSGASVGPAIELEGRQVERTFALLAHSFLWWVQGFANNKMLAPGARLLALSSPCVDFYLRNTGVIGAAKAALEAYVKTLAVELGDAGVRVNALRFGAVKSEALGKVMGNEGMAVLDALHDAIAPTRRMQTPDDVAAIVRTVATPGFAFVNGAVIDATGGSPLKLMDYAFHAPRGGGGELWRNC